MKRTIKDVLQSADPLKHEPSWTAQEWNAMRQKIASPSDPGTAKRADWPRRSILTAFAAVILTLLAIAFGFGSGIWSPRVQASVHFEMRLAEDNPAPGLQAATVAGTSRTVYIHEETLISNGDITHAAVTPGRTSGIFDVAVSFTAEGAEKIGRATAGHIGRPIALLIDGSVVNAPTVRDAIGNSAVINGNFTQAEAEFMAAGIEKR
jgi:hypothetical protein